MTRTMLLLGLLLANSAVLVAEPLWIGMLRNDGILIPLFVQHDGAWSTPWPTEALRGEAVEPEALIDPSYQKNLVFDEALTLSHIPSLWTDGVPVPATWHPFTHDVGPAHVSQAVRYTSHCITMWGLSEGEMGYAGNSWPLGVVDFMSSQNLAGTPVQPVAEDDPAFAAAWSTVEGLQQKYEAEDLAPVKDQILGTHTSPALSILRAKGDGTAFYRISASATHAKRPESNDASCAYVTLFEGWIESSNKGMRLIEADHNLTDCDQKGSDTRNPKLTFAADGRTLLLSRDMGWETESYSLHELTHAGLTRIASVEGGGC